MSFRRNLMLANSLKSNDMGGGKLINNITLNLVQNKFDITSEVTLDYPLASSVIISFDNAEYLPLYSMYVNQTTSYTYYSALNIMPTAVASIDPEEDDMYIYNVILNI